MMDGVAENMSFGDTAPKNIFLIYESISCNRKAFCSSCCHRY